MNGHVGSSNVGYGGMLGGFGYKDRRIQDLRVCRWTKPSHLQHLFMKQESQLVTYAAGPVKSMVDYIIVWQEEKAR